VADFADKLEAIAAKAEPGLAKAIRDLLLTQVTGLDMEALERAAKSGEIEEVMRIVGTTDKVKAQGLADALADVVWQGGAATAGQAAVLAEAQFVFRKLNPVLTRWLEGYSLDLIKDINTGTREAVRAALIKGMNAGDNPIQVARQIKQSVGLTETQSRAVQNYRRQLETIHTRRSLKAWGLGNERSKQSGLDVMRLDENGEAADGIKVRRLRDQRYDRALQKAIDTKSPLSQAQIDKMVDAYQRRYIQYRARNIARTEAIRACNVGTYEAWRQAIASDVVPGANVRKQWVVSKDERTCPVCSGIPELNPKEGVMLDANFRTTKGAVKLAPVHPSCRCTIFVRHWEDYQLQGFEAERVAAANGEPVEKAKRDDSNRPNAHQRGYTRQWKNEREAYLETHKRCSCGARATVVDHKQRHRQGGAFWRRSNWQPKCEACHNRKTGSGG